MIRKQACVHCHAASEARQHAWFVAQESGKVAHSHDQGGATTRVNS